MGQSAKEQSLWLIAFLSKMDTRASISNQVMWVGHGHLVCANWSYKVSQSGTASGTMERPRKTLPLGQTLPSPAALVSLWGLQVQDLLWVLCPSCTPGSNKWPTLAWSNLLLLFHAELTVHTGSLWSLTDVPVLCRYSTQTTQQPWSHWEIQVLEQFIVWWSKTVMCTAISSHGQARQQPPGHMVVGGIW